MASLEFAEILPSFTFVIFTGFVPSLSDTLIFPSVVAENFGPSLLPTCTVSKEGFSTVANVILPFLLCVTSKFLPAIISIVLPALIASPFAFTVLFPFLVPSPALAFNVKAALFTAFTTESTVAILPVSSSFTFTVPGVVPASIPPVTTSNPLSPVVIVLLSVFAFTPSVPTVKDFSSAFTVISLVVLTFCKPLPRFTSYLIVEVELSASVFTTTVVPLPSTKFTVSYGFTKSFATPFSCKFQPACNTSPTVAALFLIPSTLLGTVALVVGTGVPFFAPSKLPPTLAITLPPLFKPSFVTDTGFLPSATGVIVTPSPLMTVLSPASFLNSADSNSVNFFANLIFKVFSSAYLTLIFLSDKLSPSAPPKIFKR